MSKYFEYKGYYGSAEISVDDGVAYGKIMFVNDLVTYEADTISELKSEFEKAVDEYLEYCHSVGKEPDKTYKGSFNVRISPELHRQISIISAMRGITINQFVSNAIEHEVQHKNS